MKFNFKQFLVFFIINNVLNIIGWYYRFDEVTYFIYPLNIKDALGMIFWNSFFQIMLFLNYKKYNFKLFYLIFILFIPRLLTYILSYKNNDFELMEILNSYNGLQSLWIEPLFHNNYKILNEIIDRHILYFIAISLQISTVYFLSKKIVSKVKN